MKLLFLKFITVNCTLNELKLLVICTLSYTGFLRYDELSNIKANNITVHEQYVDIFIEKSKTDCYRNSKNVLIAKLNTPQYPVTILQCYIREAKIDLCTDKYIFTPLTYFKRPIKNKELLTADLMKLLFLRFNTFNRTLKELRLLVICDLSYTGFLRYDELSNIKANNSTFHEEYVDIFIEKSKTDCYRNVLIKVEYSTMSGYYFTMLYTRS